MCATKVTMSCFVEVFESQLSGTVYCLQLLSVADMIHAWRDSVRYSMLLMSRQHSLASVFHMCFVIALNTVIYQLLATIYTLWVDGWGHDNLTSVIAWTWRVNVSASDCYCKGVHALCMLLLHELLYLAINRVNLFATDSNSCFSMCHKLLYCSLYKPIRLCL